MHVCVRHLHSLCAEHRQKRRREVFIFMAEQSCLLAYHSLSGILTFHAMKETSL